MRPEWAIVDDKFSYKSGLLWYFDKHVFYVETAVSTFGRFMKIWATFYCNLCSHWLKSLNPSNVFRRRLRNGVTEENVGVGRGGANVEGNDDDSRRKREAQLLIKVSPVLWTDSFTIWCCKSAANLIKALLSLISTSLELYLTRNSAYITTLDS